MTREQNGTTVALQDATGKWYIYSRETGHKWAAHDTVDDAWREFYRDLYATWPQWRRDDAAVQEPA